MNEHINNGCAILSSQLFQVSLINRVNVVQEAGNALHALVKVSINLVEKFASVSEIEMQQSFDFCTYLGIWSFLLSIAGAIHRFGHVIHCTHPWERGRDPEVSAGSPQH
jgi:hypothetical protein